MQSLHLDKELALSPYHDMLGVLSRDVSARAFGPVRCNMQLRKLELMLQDGQQTGLQYAAAQCWWLICSELIGRGADVTVADTVIVMFGLFA